MGHPSRTNRAFGSIPHLRAEALGTGRIFALFNSLHPQIQIRPSSDGIHVHSTSPVLASQPPAGPADKEISMSGIWKSATVLCGAAMLVTVIASPASAGCVDPPSVLSQRGRTPLLHLPGKGSPAFSEGNRLSDATPTRTRRSWASGSSSSPRRATTWRRFSSTTETHSMPATHSGTATRRKS